MPVDQPESFDLNAWLKQFVDVMNETFSSRIVFLGLQGSRARGEATPQSDIDDVVILDTLGIADLARYREAIAVLPERDKMCGFISGKNEILNWDKSDLFQFCHDTRPLLGSLKFLADTVRKSDVYHAVLSGAGNIYHAVGHNFVHERDPGILLACCKTAVFVMQAEFFCMTDVYLPTKKELQSRLGKEERAILDDLQFLQGVGSKHTPVDSECELPRFQECSARLLAWSSRLLEEYGKPIDFKTSVLRGRSYSFRVTLFSKQSLSKKFRDLTDGVKDSRQLGISRRETFGLLENVARRLDDDKLSEGNIIEGNAREGNIKTESTLLRNTPTHSTSRDISNRRLCEVVMKSQAPGYCGTNSKQPIEIRLPDDFRKKLNSLVWKSVCLWCQAIVLVTLAFCLLAVPFVSMGLAGWSESAGVFTLMGIVMGESLLAALYYESYFKPRRIKLWRKRIAVIASSARENILGCLYVRQRRQIIWRRTASLMLFMYVLFFIGAAYIESPISGAICFLTIVPALILYIHCISLWLNTFVGKVLAVPAIVFVLPVVCILAAVYYPAKIVVTLFAELLSRCFRR